MFRLKITEEAMIAGERAPAIQECLAAAGRVISVRSVKDYIAAVRRKWEEEDKIHGGASRQRQLRDLYATAKAMKANKAWSSWVSTQKLIAELEGNFPQEGELPASQVGEFENWNDDELEEYILSGGLTEPKWLKVAREAGTRTGDFAPSEDDEKANGKGNGKSMPTPSDLLH